METEVGLGCRGITKEAFRPVKHLQESCLKITRIHLKKSTQTHWALHLWSQSQRNSLMLQKFCLRGGGIKEKIMWETDDRKEQQDLLTYVMWKQFKTKNQSTLE